jgi:hypothetical protein
MSLRRTNLQQKLKLHRKFGHVLLMLLWPILPTSQHFLTIHPYGTQKERIKA